MIGHHFLVYSFDSLAMRAAASLSSPEIELRRGREAIESHAAYPCVERFATDQLTTANCRAWPSSRIEPGGQCVMHVDAVRLSWPAPIGCRIGEYARGERWRAPAGSCGGSVWRAAAKLANKYVANRSPPVIDFYCGVVRTRGRGLACSGALVKPAAMRHSPV